MKYFTIFVIILTALGLGSCRDSDITIGDSPISSNGQDRDSDIITGDDYVYHLPVIFHVFYKDSKNPKQYISSTRLKELLSNVNELYQGNVYNISLDTIESENIHVQFELAEKDANGKKLSTPGVEYIKINEDSIDCEDFMNSKTYAKYSWNQNDYINVMVYSFKNTDHTSVTLGISNIPYKVAGYPDIEGLTNSKNYPLNKPGSFPYCVSLNAIYVDKKYEGTRYTTDKHQQNYQYNTADPNATLAHELGHYLGLFHTFSEKAGKKDKSEAADDDDDSDYCEDTPSYNRIAYGKWLTLYMEEARKINKDTAFTVKQLAKRTNTKGKEWQADNLMDYSICYSMRFTPDQAYRMRQVLYYSPTHPGSKESQNQHKSLERDTRRRIRPSEYPGQGKNYQAERYPDQNLPRQIIRFNITNKNSINNEIYN